ncbi:hypothetical protein [Actinoplanes sp. NPDC049316]|uniref:hypothetical protein n=1 Tax=Actinoplanes sp. NPDC049316 TaxID=3154727 RepID=UPI00344188CA
MAARARTVVTVACLVQFVDAVGVTLLIVALPAMQRDRRRPFSRPDWVRPPSGG